LRTFVGGKEVLLRITETHVVQLWESVMTTGLGILTTIHTLLSVIAIIFGAVVVVGLVRNASPTGSLRPFLITAIATSVTGFFFPFKGMTPGIAVGIVALIVLALIIAAQRMQVRSHLWTAIYAAGLVCSEYLLIFVAIAQAFTKVPALHAAAPTLKETPFAAAQCVALLLFAVVGVVSIRRLARVSGGLTGTTSTV
jgi:hypothetical protein